MDIIYNCLNTMDLLHFLELLTVPYNLYIPEGTTIPQVVIEAGVGDVVWEAKTGVDEWCIVEDPFEADK